MMALSARKTFIYHGEFACAVLVQRSQSPTWHGRVRIKVDKEVELD